jgi:hypothetical protein
MTNKGSARNLKVKTSIKSGGVSLNHNSTRR